MPDSLVIKRYDQDYDYMMLSEDGEYVLYKDIEEYLPKHRAFTYPKLSYHMSKSDVDKIILKIEDETARKSIETQLLSRTPFVVKTFYEEGSLPTHIYEGVSYRKASEIGLAGFSINVRLTFIRRFTEAAIPSYVISNWEIERLELKPLPMPQPPVQYEIKWPVIEGIISSGSC